MNPHALAIALTASLAAGATADMDVLSLGTPLDGFYGTREFRAYYESTDSYLDVDVDFAVFGPDDYTGGGSASGAYAGFDGIDANEYVYAFQFQNLSSSTVPMSNMTLDLLEGSVISGVGYNNLSGTVNATFPDVVSESYLAYWFVAPQLGVEQDSVFVMFSSPQAPTFAYASIMDGGIATQVDGGLPTPNPVPVPGAVALGAIGMTMIGAVRRRLS